MKRNDILLLVNGIISLALIAIILNYVGLSDFIKTLGSVNLFMLFLGMVFLLIMDLVMSYRIKMLLDFSKNGIPFLDIIKAHFVGMLCADFTPARSGYFAAAGVLHYKYKVNSEHAMLSIFGPQIFDFGVKVTAGTVALLYLLYHFIGPGKGWIMIAGSVMLAAVIAVMMLLLFSERFLRMFSFSKRLPVAASAYGLFSRMQQNSHMVVKLTPQILVLIVFSWVAKAISWYFVAKSVGITVNTGFPEPLFYLFLQPLVTILEFIPTPTIAGMGLSEGGTTAVFALFGIPVAAAATFALLVRFKTTFVHLPAVPEALATLRMGDRDKVEEGNAIGGEIAA
jgi:uncharacterized protein (TIRG00374 family)